jgi:hypothetical protein
LDWGGTLVRKEIVELAEGADHREVEVLEDFIQ